MREHLAAPKLFSKMPGIIQVFVSVVPSRHRPVGEHGICQQDRGYGETAKGPEIASCHSAWIVSIAGVGRRRRISFDTNFLQPATGRVTTLLHSDLS